MAHSHSSTRPDRSDLLGLVVGISLLASACTSGSGPDDAERAEETSAFCSAVEASLAIEQPEPSGEDTFDAALDLAPPELEATVQGIRATDQDEPSEEDMSHVQDLLIWMGDHCNTNGEAIRRIAPPAAPVGFVSCGDMGAIPVEQSPQPEGAMVAYGDASLDSPFNGTVISILTGVLAGPGDQPSTDVIVQGNPAVTGPARFFQGGGGPESTRVVAWELDGVDVTVIGRGFGEDRADELVALANEVQLIDDVATLPGTTFDEIYAGSIRPAMATVPFFVSQAEYQANYRQLDDLGTVSVNGLRLTPAEFSAARAFFFDSEPREFNGHDGFVADAWSETGPYVAAWQEPDGQVVWVSGIGVARETTIDIAEASTELTAEQWKETTRFSSECNNEHRPGDR